MASQPSMGLNLTQVSKKDKPWNTHKKENSKIGALYGEDLRFHRYSERMAECADWLEFAEVDDHDKKLKLTRASFCHVRHCPICSWRKCLALIARFRNNMPEYLETCPDYSYIYLVLTCRNCEMSELRDTIQWLNNGVAKLLKRKSVKNIVHGFIKTVEVTKGKDGNPHPHINLILAVNKSYFKSKFYIKKLADRDDDGNIVGNPGWVDLWQSCLNVDYQPSVFVSRVKRRKKKDAGKGDASPEDDLMSGILEVSKYSVKPADIVDDKDFLYGITIQCHKLRFLSTGGCLSGIFDKGPKGADEIDSDEMMLKDDDENSEKASCIRQIYLWYKRQGYILKQVKKISSDPVEADREFREDLTRLIRDKRKNE